MAQLTWRLTATLHILHIENNGTQPNREQFNRMVDIAHYLEKRFADLTLEHQDKPTNLCNKMARYMIRHESEQLMRNTHLVIHNQQDLAIIQQAAKQSLKQELNQIETQLETQLQKSRGRNTGLSL